MVRSVSATSVFAVSVFIVGNVLAEWPDPIANDVLPYETTGLVHGPLLGRPTSGSVRVWVRTMEATSFEVLCGQRLPLGDDAVVVAGRTDSETDLAGTVDIVGLKPATEYFYAIRIGDHLADLRESMDASWPSFRTLPDETVCVDALHNPDGHFNLAFAVGHCASQAPVESGGQYASTPAYQTIAGHDEVDFAIVNGDVIYESDRDGTLQGVRQNYRTYFSRGRSFESLFRRVPGLFTFDDHDIGWDIHGCGQVGLGEGPHLIRDIGLKAYRENLAWANFVGPQTGSLRFGNASVEKGSGLLHDPDANFTQVDLDAVSTIHLGNYTRTTESVRRETSPKNAGVYRLVEVVDATHLRIEPKPKHDETLPYSIGTHHYYDWKIGNCQFLAVDTRGERSKLNARDRSSDRLFMMGDAQKKWFKETIANSTADFIFIVSPDPWVIFHTAAHVRTEPGADRDDKGDGYPSFVHEREDLITFLDDIKKPVLIFTGDVHAAASVRITDNVWEMMCGPLGSTGHPLGTLGNPPLGGVFNSQDRDVLIRWVSGFPNNVHYSRLRNAYYGVVQVNNVLKVASPTGTRPQWMAYEQPTVTVRWHDGYDGSLVYAETVSTMDAR